jgi:hypothetical protein
MAVPEDWAATVNRAETQAELLAVRQAVVRGSPYGDAAWQAHTAMALGLGSSLRPRGRPRQSQEEDGNEPDPFFSPEGGTPTNRRRLMEQTRRRISD